MRDFGPLEHKVHRRLFLLPYGLGWFVGALILTAAGPLFTTR